VSAYLVRRLIHLVPTFLGATFLAFFVLQIAPGDFLTQWALDPKIRPETIERMRHNFGLDRPLLLQYLIWLKNLLHGDFGTSFMYQRPVLEVVWPRIENSLILVGLSILFLYLIGIPVGVYQALRPYTLPDYVISFFAYFGLAIPNFFFMLILIFLLVKFKFAFGWTPFPIGGMTSQGFEQLPPARQWVDILWHAVLPAFVVVTADLSGLTRVMRGQVMEVLGQDYIRTARAKGLAERIVLYKHALRNAVIPILANIGGLLPGLIGGAGLVEVVANWPGITPLLLDALNQQDLYVNVGIIALSSLLLIVGNILGDLLLAVVDPRIRYG